MKRRRFAATLLAFMLLLSCSFIPAAAAEVSSADIVTIMPRVTGRLNHSISANTITYIGQPISLDKGETITYDCTYTPKSASLDFGYVASDGLFYSINCTTGSINKSIKMDKAGQYTLAICNNESYPVTVTGTINY